MQLIIPLYLMVAASNRSCAVSRLRQSSTPCCANPLGLFCARRAFRGRRHDLVREPDAGKLPVPFDERRLETEPRREVRHRHCESCRQQLPPIRLPPPRQSSTLLSARAPSSSSRWPSASTDAGSRCPAGSSSPSQRTQFTSVSWLPPPSQSRESQPVQSTTSLLPGKSRTSSNLKYVHPGAMSLV